MIEIGLRPLAALSARTGGRIADSYGNVRVGLSLAVGDVEQRQPNFLLKFGSIELQRQVKTIALTVEIFFQLALRF